MSTTEGPDGPPGGEDPRLRLTETHAIVPAPDDTADPSEALVLHPLAGRIPAAASAAGPGRWRLDLPHRPDAAFPQLDASHGEGWSVWPCWRLHPVEGSNFPDDPEPLAWRSQGLRTLPLPGETRGTLEFLPGMDSAPGIARDALDSLIRWYGPLPWSCVHLLIEPQQWDYGHDKGFALVYPSGIWCRAQLRPGGRPGLPRDRARAIELIVHEILHHLLEFDTPPGHALTEGLITYLARRLVVVAGHADRHWLDLLAADARRDLRRWHLEGMSLRAASRRFFKAESARRVAYRKGYLLMREIDRASGGRLPDLCRRLAARAALTGGRLTESRFVAALGGKARTCYLAATG